MAQSAPNGAPQPTPPADTPAASQVEPDAGTPQPATQTSSEAQPTAAGEGTGSTEVGEVVVTGSRIRRSEFSAPLPIQVLSADQSSLEGLADPAQVLQGSSLAAGAFQFNNQLTGFVTEGGGGTNTISLRGLGSQRTLVLLNGHRLGPAGTRGSVGPVDLNVIPQSIVERYEILKDGASSIYGSDAVAGVINIITRRNFDGGELGAYTRVSEDGGGNEYQLFGSFGRRFDRGFFTASAEYYRQEELNRGDRDDTSCAADYLFSADRTTRIDYRDANLNRNGGYKCYNLVNNVVDTYDFGRLQYVRPEINYAVPGNNSPFPGLARQARAGYPDTYPYANYDSPFWDRGNVLSPVERYNLALTGGYTLSNNAELYGEFLYSRRESSQTDAQQLFPTLAEDNPNNVVGGVQGEAINPIIAIPLTSSQTIDYYRFLGGIRGDIPLPFGEGWRYDAYFSHTRSSGAYRSSITFNDRVDATTAYATGCEQSAINISGGSCSLVPNGIPWVSQRVLAGQFTEAERGFLFGEEIGHTRYDQTIAEATLSGDLLQLPAGALGVAVGVSYRNDEIDDSPGYNAENQNYYGLTTAGRTVGSDRVREVFGELEAPLLRDLPGIQNLTLQVSGRYSDYASYGANSTYRLGLNWQVIPQLRLRGTYGTSFRAPSLYELYLSNQTGFLGQTTIDPCINYQDNGNAAIRANCLSQGIPEGYTGVSPNGGGGGSATIISGGGAGILEAENSDALTLGVVLTPSYRGFNFNVAVDYFEIKVENEVAQLGAGGILNQCYRATNFPNNAYCSLVTRDLNPASPSYLNVLSVNDSYINVARQDNRGIDLTIRVDREFDFGRLTLSGQGTWQIRDVTRTLPDTPEVDYLGSTYGFRGPDFVGNVNVRFDRGPWTVFWGVDLIGKGSDTEIAGGDTFAYSRYYNLPAGVTGTQVYFKQYTEFQTYHSLSARYTMNDWTLQGGVRNLFDDRPPAGSQGQFRVGTAALNGYDLTGRSFFLNVTRRF